MGGWADAFAHDPDGNRIMRRDNGDSLVEVIETDRGDFLDSFYVGPPRTHMHDMDRSPNGRFVAFVALTDELFVTVMSPDGVIKDTWSVEVLPNNVRWNAASNVIYYDQGEDLKRIPIDPGTGERTDSAVTIMSVAPMRFAGFDVSRDNRTITYNTVRSRSHVWTVDARVGEGRVSQLGN